MGGGTGRMKSVGTLDLSFSLGPWVSSYVCQSVIACDRAGSEPGASPLHLTGETLADGSGLTGDKAMKSLSGLLSSELGPCLFPSDRMVKCPGTSLP